MKNKLTRSEQSRLNGSHSKGPTSEQGKAISSANSLKHGFAAVINVVLEIEDKAAFETHAQKLRNSFKPQDYAEECYVDQLAAIEWRQARLVGLESALIDNQAALQKPHLEAQNPESANDPYFKLLHAWQALARQPRPPTVEELADASLPQEAPDIASFELLRRYQSSLARQHRATLLNLQTYRKTFGTNAAAPPAPTPAQQNEPEKPPQPTRILTFPPPEQIEQPPLVPICVHLRSSAAKPSVSASASHVTLRPDESSLPQCPRQSC